MQNTTMTVLLVEDNPDHAELIQRNLEDLEIRNRIIRYEDGESALNYLLGRGEYGDASKWIKPHLILLDLRLPKIDGLQVLKEIKTTPETSGIPVVVLTTSDTEKDMAMAYEYHANSYVTKPIEFEGFTKLLHDLGLYWLAWNKTQR